MISHDIASFTIYGGHRTVAEITALLGIEPDSSGDTGDLTPSGRAGRKFKPRHLTYQQTHWSLTATADDDGTDTYLRFGAVESLLL